jgi:hypothetical protein
MKFQIESRLLMDMVHLMNEMDETISNEFSGGAGTQALNDEAVDILNAINDQVVDLDTLDIYGRQWLNVPFAEKCLYCKQPDNCGDCNHNPLSETEVLELGGKL